MSLKNKIRSTLIFFHCDITKNLEYDRLTQIIMKRVIKSDSNCIDIGCHKGEILDMILELAPNAKHYGFEPIPTLFNNLKAKYEGRAIIYPFALSNEKGESTFQFVKNAPAYSGLKKRKYDVATPDIEEIKVEVNTLDNLFPKETKIDMIKIDVEGGEFNVLKGGKELLIANKPVIIFECGLGGSEFYGTEPLPFYKFITEEIGLKISTLKSFIANKPSLTSAEYEVLFNTNKEYYFIAHL